MGLTLTISVFFLNIFTFVNVSSFFGFYVNRNIFIFRLIF